MVKGCLSSVNFSVFINGKPRGHFGASRGIRQGDPLSPFLFILIADTLSRLMKRACDKDLIEGFVIGRDKVRLSHLQFANDSIFFMSNKEDNIINLMGVLNLFSLISGLKVNMGKSKVVGINMEAGRVDDIANGMGCSKGSWPMEYLGLPLGGNPSSYVFWEPVIEKR